MTYRLIVIKVRVFGFVTKRNLSCGEICHAGNLGNLAIPKEAELRIKKRLKTDNYKYLLRLSKLHLWSSEKPTNLHVPRVMLIASHNYIASPPTKPTPMYIVGILVKTRHS